MKILNLMKILLLCVITAGLVSCGDDNYYTMKNSDDKLCGKVWEETYLTTNKEGAEVQCCHQLKFVKGASGQEVWGYYREWETRPYEVVTRYFSWKWTDDVMEGLELDYGASNVVYFDNVWTRENYLSGRLNGKDVLFSISKKGLLANTDKM